MFSAHLLAVVAAGRRVSCNCFGRTAQPVSILDVVRNAGIVGCACAGLIMAAAGAAHDASPTIEDTLLTAVLSCAAVSVWLRLGSIAMLLGPAPELETSESAS